MMLMWSNILIAAVSRDSNPNHDSLVPYLLRNHDNEDGVCLDFFTEAVSRINEDDTIAPIFCEAMAIMSSRVAKMTMNDDYKPYINVRPG
jgi:ubiquitin conjugation factor E4 B